MRKLAIITTHPIQYNAPFFALLGKRNRIQVKVFYTWGEAVLKDKFDPGFGKSIEWDIPLLDGYEYQFVNNIATEPGSHHFNGIVTPDLKLAIETWKADAVLVYGWAFKSHLKLMRQMHGKIPVLFRGDSTSMHQSNPFKKMIRRLFLKWIYSHIDCALYVGTNNKIYYKETGVNEDRLVFMPHAVDNDRFRHESEKAATEVTAWKQRLGIPEKDLVLLYAGKLDANKNVQLLLEAFAGKERKGVQLLIAGNGVLENHLKEKYAGSEQIYFLPFQNQSAMPALYAMADVYMLPSLTETWGLAINEAMACGKAVLVSSGCGAARDLVKAGENGYIFKSNDKIDMGDKLDAITASMDKVKSMGDKSRQVIESWSFEKSCEILEAEIMRLTKSIYS